MAKYEWAVLVTMDLLDGKGNVESTESNIRPADSESQARTRHEAIQDAIAHAATRTHPKYQRLASSELIRRYVSEWETVPE
jgi:hypothetical protein